MFLKERGVPHSADTSCFQPWNALLKIISKSYPSAREHWVMVNWHTELDCFFVTVLGLFKFPGIAYTKFQTVKDELVSLVHVKGVGFFPFAYQKL